MSVGKTAAQSVHAALGLVGADPMMSAVVLHVTDAKFEEAKHAHMDAYVVHDAGYTEVPAGTQTCMAFYDDVEHAAPQPTTGTTTVGTPGKPNMAQNNVQRLRRKQQRARQRRSR